MLRGFRHIVLWYLQGVLVGIGLIALAVQPAAWPAILICTGGACLASFICARHARRYLRSTLGRLRRVAEDVGHGRPAEPLDAQPGDDLYKLANAINRLAAEIVRSSGEARQLQEQLRRSERLAFLGELAASVAHEVNNPLDGVQNCVRILRRSTDDPARVAQMLDLIDSGLDRIELIVRRLLTLARHHVIRPAPTRMRDVLERVAAQESQRLAGRDVLLCIHGPEGDDTCAAEAALLEQVFVNLIQNAADSMPAGGVIDVHIRAAWSGAPGEPAVTVEVADRGAGVPKDILPHIFEPFFTTKRDGKGTGLGLAIAARIVDAHRGRIDVRPRAGGGSVFSVCIPAVAPRWGSSAADLLPAGRAGGAL